MRSPARDHLRLVRPPVRKPRAPRGLRLRRAITGRRRRGHHRPGPTGAGSPPARLELTGPPRAASAAHILQRALLARPTLAPSPTLLPFSRRLRHCLVLTQGILLWDTAPRATPCRTLARRLQSDISREEQTVSTCQITGRFNTNSDSVLGLGRMVAPARLEGHRIGGVHSPSGCISGRPNQHYGTTAGTPRLLSKRSARYKRK